MTAEGCGIIPHLISASFSNGAFVDADLCGDGSV
jgi:hypothetical protein